MAITYLIILIMCLPVLMGILFGLEVEHAEAKE